MAASGQIGGRRCRSAIGRSQTVGVRTKRNECSACEVRAGPRSPRAGTTQRHPNDRPWAETNALGSADLEFPHALRDVLRLDANSLRLDRLDQGGVVLLGLIRISAREAP